MRVFPVENLVLHSRGLLSQPISAEKNVPPRLLNVPRAGPQHKARPFSAVADGQKLVFVVFDPVDVQCVNESGCASEVDARGWVSARGQDKGNVVLAYCSAKVRSGLFGSGYGWRSDGNAGRKSLECVWTICVYCTEWLELALDSIEPTPVGGVEP